MTTSLHVKVNYPEAISLKKEVLNIEESLLKTIENAKDYNELRKREYFLKTKLRKLIVSLRNKLIALEYDMPKEDLSKIRRKMPIHISKKEIISKIQPKILSNPKIEPHKEDAIGKQLAEIRDKLARLE